MLYLTVEDAQEFIELGWPDKATLNEAGVINGYTAFPKAAWITPTHLKICELDLNDTNTAVVKPEDIWALKLLDVNLWPNYLASLKQGNKP